MTQDVPFQVAVTCTRCGGNGAEPGTEVSTCPTCAGTGRLQQVSRSVFGEFVRTQACPTCAGTGRKIEQPCTQCDGAGRVLEERRLEVEIPAGIHDGQQIRITGEGHAGVGGTRAGDVYVQVRVRPDARFVREGDDVFSTVDLTMTQAALGATLTIPTLDGDEQLEFAAGTQPGEVRVLRGRGMPVLQGFGRGDHRVLVQRPRSTASELDEQRRILSEFDVARRRADVHVGRRHLREDSERVSLRRVFIAGGEVELAALLTYFPAGVEEVEGGFAVYVDGPVPSDFTVERDEPVAEGWEDAWRAFHRGIPVGRLWVGPPWERPPADLVPVVIEPGRAFGTGAHPTTQLCLELLQELEPASLLDIGCGSGVLSIAAAKLGFAPVTAVDVDPVAIEVTQANAAVNGVEIALVAMVPASSRAPRLLSRTSRSLPSSRSRLRSMRPR